MDNPKAESSSGPLLWSRRKLPWACGCGVTCGQPECPPTGLGISHQLRTWNPGGGQTLGTQAGACWPTDQGCVARGLYKVARRHTFQESTNPGGQTLPTSSISRGELGSSIVLTNVFLFYSPWNSFISRDCCCTFAQLYLQPHGPQCARRPFFSPFSEVSPSLCTLHW